MYGLFQERLRQSAGKEEDFFAYVKRFLAKADNRQSGMSQVALEGGFKFALTLLGEIKDVVPGMVDKSLDYFIVMFR